MGQSWGGTRQPPFNLCAAFMNDPYRGVSRHLPVTPPTPAVPWEPAGLVTRQGPPSSRPHSEINQAAEWRSWGGHSLPPCCQHRSNHHCRQSSCRAQLLRGPGRSAQRCRVQQRGRVLEHTPKQRFPTLFRLQTSTTFRIEVQPPLEILDSLWHPRSPQTTG